jgi:serine/threonine-protein kinase
MFTRALVTKQPPNETPDHDLNLLDGYLARLQAGERPDREAFVREHPELVLALHCLEALEMLAPPSGLLPLGAVPDGSQSAGFQPAGFQPAGPMPSGDPCHAGQLIERSTTGQMADLPEMPRDFGSYELIREIGRGGMGVVYEARQKGLDRSVAVKMILASHLASADIVRRFQAEAKAAARLRHPNIVPIHEVGQFHGQHFFSMEYIGGQSLAEKLAQGSLDDLAAARLVAAVARAVEHLHQQGIIHRDLKPSNILMDAEGRPYVTDFGLAIVFAVGAERTATGVIAGTPSYMAPEQASGRRAEIGPATDVYSLGAILFELLTGKPPFKADNPLDTLLEVLGSDPPTPRSLNPHAARGLERICLKCLAKDPAGRYPSAAALADDLDRFVRGDVLHARPPTLMQRCGAWTRRQPALASRLAVLGLFYLIDTVNYRAGAIDSRFHQSISLVVALWIIASVACQQLLGSRRWSIPACFIWGTLDSMALLAVLKIADGAASALVVGYPLIIVASGLWFRVRFVGFMTLLSLLSYGVLVIDFYYWRPELHAGMHAGMDRHVIFALALLVIGAVVAYLVQRVRTLSNFFVGPE